MKSGLSPHSSISMFEGKQEMGCAASTDAISDDNHHRRVDRSAPQRITMPPPIRESDLTRSPQPDNFSPGTRKRLCLVEPESLKCSREFAAMLPQRTVDCAEVAGGAECPICMGPVSGSLVVTLPCLHIYHKDCAVKWLTRHEGSCPECRTRVCAENYTWPPLQMVSASDVTFAADAHRADPDTVRIDDS